VVPADALQGAALADYLVNIRFDRRAYLIDDGSAAGTAAASTFTNRWQQDFGKLLWHASVAPTTVSFVNLLTSIAALNPDVVVYTGADEGEGVRLREQMVMVPGLQNTQFAVTSPLHTAAFLQDVGPIGGQVWAVAPEPTLASLSSSASFATSYQAKFGTP